MQWKLTVRYMGASATDTVPEAELADPWTFVEISEDIDKCDGGHFEDGDGPTEHPLAWKDGRATETRCGPWKGGFDDGHRGVLRPPPGAGGAAHAGARGHPRGDVRRRRCRTPTLWTPLTGLSGRWSPKPFRR